MDDDNTELITAGSLVTLSVTLVRTSLGEGGVLELGSLASDEKELEVWYTA